jgi:hypothetical protein
MKPLLLRVRALENIPLMLRFRSYTAGPLSTQGMLLADAAALYHPVTAARHIDCHVRWTFHRQSKLTPSSSFPMEVRLRKESWSIEHGGKEDNVCTIPHYSPRMSRPPLSPGYPPAICTLLKESLILLTQLIISRDIGDTAPSRFRQCTHVHSHTHSELLIGSRLGLLLFVAS